MALRAAQPADEDEPVLIVPDETLVSLAEQLQRLCIERHQTVATAESCTGGLVAGAITAVPGSSGYFLGGFVTYADAAKVQLLGIPEPAISAHGAVSAQVARAMATGALERLGASMAVSSTGVAGPDGGSAAKPVGLVYLGLAWDGDADVRRLTLEGDRAAIREAATAAALEWLIERATRAG
ncbi:MAG: nicotinamide-nucleotide amidase [Chloroflexota bacterium]|nr:nicotinamide-nucleotide amidase [Chloroflexota bacterium]